MTDPAFLFQRLLLYYSQGYEMASPYMVDNTIYDTYAYYSSGHSYEHAFIRNTIRLSKGDLKRFRHHIESYIEPELICAGTGLPPQGHLYTNITGVFITEDPVSEEVKQMIRRFHYYKGYGFFRHGYCQARIAVFDTATGQLFCNHAAKNLMDEYKRILGR